MIAYVRGLQLDEERVVLRGDAQASTARGCLPIDQSSPMGFLSASVGRSVSTVEFGLVPTVGVRRGAYVEKDRMHDARVRA